jgi:hypothetical protein
MKKAKKIAALLVAFAALITGCSESYTPAGSVETPATVDVSEVERTTQEEELSQVEETLQEPEIKIEINTELLSEFGMTFAELEEKYGKAVSGKTEKTDFEGIGIRYTYFFENGKRGYTFISLPDDVTENTLPDGTPLVKEDNIYNFFSGQAKDLFLGLDEIMSMEEFEKIYGVYFPVQPADSDSPDWQSGFWYSNKCHVNMNHEKRGMVEPNYYLEIRFE